MAVRGSVDIPFTNSTQIANHAVDIANSKPDIFYGQDEPINPKEGDLWNQTNNIDDSVSVHQYIDGAWVPVQGLQGPKGDQGIPGKTGTDGKTPYLHIAYADDSNGSGFSQFPKGKAYMGTYTDYTAADSTDPSKYNWVLIKGEKGDTGATGPQGPQGPAGKDGIAYMGTTAPSNPATNSTWFQTDSTGKVIAIKKWTGSAWIIAKIDADTLNVGQLSALSADLGNVTAGSLSGVSLNIGNGNFTVDTAGNLVAKRGTFSGTIISNNATITGGSLKVGSNFNVDSYGNLTANSATFGGNMSLNGVLNIATTLTGNDTSGLSGRYNYSEETAAYNSKKLNGIYNLNSAYLSFKTIVNIPDSNTNYFAETYYGPSAMKFRAYNTSSNGSYDGSFSGIRDRIDVSPHQITMGQTASTTSPNWKNEIEIFADGQINASQLIHSDKWLEANNMRIGYHTIASLDSGKVYFMNNTTNGSRIDIGIATLDYTGSLSKSSSETLKANIKLIDFSALDEIMNTDFYSYNYLSDLDRGIVKPTFGPVIGDNYRLSDKFLTQSEKSISIDNMTAINSQAIKELFETMQEQNKNLIIKVADLDRRLALLEAA
ncbi:tail fiber domain-containing protein [Heyndrickxia sp. FSL W8-0423]|uniref:tail fiber domain-containing protein n=1 Tax=Heyndrickxia sp. FSL W8-0423 TaxID=2921601 RepID=UPI0030F94A29